MSTIEGISAQSPRANTRAGRGAPIRAEGFNHLHINVRDLARSIRFYEEAFGLKAGFSAGET